jgi:hypothetical protein
LRIAYLISCAEALNPKISIKISPLNFINKLYKLTYLNYLNTLFYFTTKSSNIQLIIGKYGNRML